MQIDLRGADRSVSKQFLNYAKVGPVVPGDEWRTSGGTNTDLFDACAETYFLDAFLNRCAGQWTQADRSNQTVVLRHLREVIHRLLEALTFTCGNEAILAEHMSPRSSYIFQLQCHCPYLDRWGRILCGGFWSIKT